jgi:hypothetical protein
MNSHVYNELKKRNLQTFGSQARMEARLARFVKFEQKKALAKRKAMWRRRRMAKRSHRNYQKWSDDFDYGEPIYEEEVETDTEEEVGIVDIPYVKEDKDEGSYLMLILVFVVMLMATGFSGLLSILLKVYASV